MYICIVMYMFIYRSYIYVHMYAIYYIYYIYGISPLPAAAEKNE